MCSYVGRKFEINILYLVLRNLSKIRFVYRAYYREPASCSCRRVSLTTKCTASWQNQQNDCAPSEDSDQPGHPPSLITVFAVRMKKAWILTYPLSAQRRLWSDWADAQANLRWAHVHFVGFVLRRLHRRIINVFYKELSSEVSLEKIKHGKLFRKLFLRKNVLKFKVSPIHKLRFSPKRMLCV